MARAPLSVGGSGGTATHRTTSAFKVKRALESIDAFRVRINKAAVAEKEGLGAIDAGADDWVLGERLRNVGSIHSDYWRGTAADLAQRSAIGVYPVGGWWKENPSHHRYLRTARYALIVSVRAPNGTIDIYSPVSVQLATQIEI